MAKERYIVIQEWMLDLGLKGSELLAYALIWGFCQDEESEFHGNVTYVAHWCGISRQQAVAVLKKLTDAGHISKSVTPGYPAHYRIAPEGGVKFSGVSNNLTGGVKLPDTGCQETLPPAPLNIDKHNIDIKIDTHSSPRVREDKVLYGDCVLLTEAEHARLVQRYGDADTARLIEILDLYLANKTKDPYKSHYAAIQKWVVRDLAEQKTAEQRLKNAQEAAQRVSGQQQGPPPGNYAALAEARARREAIEAKYKH